MDLDIPKNKHHGGESMTQTYINAPDYVTFKNTNAWYVNIQCQDGSTEPTFNYPGTGILFIDSYINVKKDVNTSGAFMTESPTGSVGGGAIQMGHGFTGTTDPPMITLIDSGSSYGGYNTLWIKQGDRDPNNIHANNWLWGHLELGNVISHGGLYAEHVYAKGSSSSGNGAHLWADTPGHFFLATHNATSPAWRIGYGNGSGGLDTDQPNILSDGQVLTFSHFTSIRTAAIYGETGASNVVLHGTADYATSAGTATSASSATYATSAGSSSSASAIPTYSGSDPSSPPSGSIWLRTDL